MSERLEVVEMHATRGQLLVVLVLFVGAALVLGTACGDDNGGTEASPTPMMDDSMTDDMNMDGEHEDEEGVTHVALSEWTIEGAHGEGIDTVHGGEAILEVHNEGETIHELVVLATDLDPADLPTSGDLVDEEAAGEVVGRTDSIDSGDADILTLDLEPGTYALICNIATHYELGMHAELAVE